MTDMQLTNLISFLKNHPTLRPIFGDRVYFVGGIREDNDWSIGINLMTDNHDCLCEDMVELRVTAGDSETGPMESKKKIDLVRSVIEGNDKNFSGYHVYQVSAMGDNYTAKNEKERFVSIKTFIFRYSKQ